MLGHLLIICNSLSIDEVKSKSGFTITVTCVN